MCPLREECSSTRKAEAEGRIFDTGNDSSSIAKHINRKHAHGVSKCRDCGALVPWQECEGHKCKIEKDMGKANDGEEGPEKKRARVN